jgi:hypothetical protein
VLTTGLAYLAGGWGGRGLAVCGCLMEPLRCHEEGIALCVTTVYNADGRKVVVRGCLKEPFRCYEVGTGASMQGITNTGVLIAVSSPTCLSGLFFVQLWPVIFGKFVLFDSVIGGWSVIWDSLLLNYDFKACFGRQAGAPTLIENARPSLDPLHPAQRGHFQVHRTTRYYELACNVALRSVRAGCGGDGVGIFVWFRCPGVLCSDGGAPELCGFCGSWWEFLGFVVDNLIVELRLHFTQFSPHHSYPQLLTSAVTLVIFLLFGFRRSLPPMEPNIALCITMVPSFSDTLTWSSLVTTGTSMATWPPMGRMLCWLLFARRTTRRTTHLPLSSSTMHGSSWHSTSCCMPRLSF